MDIVEFWRLIEQKRQESNTDVDIQADLLVKELVSWPSEEILEFARIFDSLVARADLYNLSDIADLIYGGFGDSGWWDFRAWLVGQGREIYERILSDPESLADIIPLNARRNIVAEQLLYVGQKAYREKTGADYLPALQPYPLEPVSRGDSLWQEVSSAEEYNRRFKEKYPKIWERFNEEDTQ